MNIEEEYQLYINYFDPNEERIDEYHSNCEASQKFDDQDTRGDEAVGGDVITGK